MANKRRHRGAQVALLAFFLLAASASFARCPQRQDVLDFVADYLNRTPTKALPGIVTRGDAQCAQGAIAAELARHMGNLAGFKAGFTHASAQKRYGVDGPLRAFLFKKMFLDSGATIEASYGARPWVEASLIAVVKDGELQTAKTPLDALQHVAYFLPYIELNDLALADGETIDGISLTATNVATRYGVIGAPIAVEATPAFLAQLADMKVVITDQNDRELERGDGNSSVDHPINTLLWLSQGLSFDGMRIMPEDKLALGTFAPAVAPQAGGRISVRYVGLPGDPSVSISFR